MPLKRKYAQYASAGSRAIAALSALKVGQMAFNSKRPAIQTEAQTGEGQGISSTIGPDHKFRQSYKRRSRRRLPYKQRKKIIIKKRKWKKFKKSVNKAITPKTQLMSINIRKDNIRGLGTWTASWSLTPTQIQNYSNDAGDLVLWETITGGSSSGVSQTSTISDIFRETFAGLNTRWGSADHTQTNFSQRGAVYICYSELQFTIRNSNTVPINYDIYEFLASRNMTYNDDYSTPSKAMNYIGGAAKAFGAGFTIILDTTRGVTPFDYPGLGKHWKILSKQTVLLGASETASFSYKGSKGIYTAYAANNYSALKGKTKHFLITAGSEVAFGALIATSGGELAVNKTYHWRPLRNNTVFTQGIYQAVTETGL